MRTQVEFELNGINVIAKATVTNAGLVRGLSLYFPELEEGTRLARKLVDEITEEAEMLLVEEAATPEVSFDE